MGRKAIWLVGVLVVALGFLFWQKGKVVDRLGFRYGTVDPSVAIDVHFTRHPDIVSMYQHVIEPLVCLDDENQLRPLLLRSLPSVSADGKSYYFSLKPDIYFHNGSKLSSYDVEFVFNRMFQGSQAAVSAASFAMIKGARAMLEQEQTTLSGFEVIDDLQFVIHLEEPFNSFLYHLSRPYAGIYSQKAYLESPYQWGSEHLIGSGPYQFERYTRREGLYLKRFERYHDQMPFFNELAFLFFRDYDDALRAYEEDQVEMVLLPPMYYETYQGEAFARQRLYQFQIGHTSILFNMQDEIFSNPLIRKAFALSIDREEILQFFHGYAQAVYNYLPAVVSGSSTHKLLPDRDIALAKELLRQAGYPQGLNIVVQYGAHHIPSSALWPIIQQQVKESGFNIILLQKNIIDWRQRLYSGELNTILVTWMASLPLADELLYEAFHSTQSHQWSSNYANAQIDQMLMLARQTQNMQERIELYQQIERIIVSEEVAILPFAWVPTIYLLKEHVVYDPGISLYHLFSQARLRQAE